MMIIFLEAPQEAYPHHWDFHRVRRRAPHHLDRRPAHRRDDRHHRVVEVFHRFRHPYRCPRCQQDSFLRRADDRLMVRRHLDLREPVHRRQSFPRSRPLRRRPELPSPRCAGYLARRR